MMERKTEFQLYSRSVLETALDLEANSEDPSYRAIFVGWFKGHAMALCDLSDRQRRDAIRVLGAMPPHRSILERRGPCPACRGKRKSGVFRRKEHTAPENEAIA